MSPSAVDSTIEYMLILLRFDAEFPLHSLEEMYGVIFWVVKFIVVCPVQS